MIKVGIFCLIGFGPVSTFALASETCPEESRLVGNICVTDLSDPTGDVPEIDPSDPDQLITLRMAVKSINESATTTSPTSAIYFDLALFDGNTSESSIVLSSPLEIRSNLHIIAPVAADSSILLTITRSENMETGTSLIVINPDSPAAVSDSDLANREVIIENVRIDSSSDSSNVLTTSGRAIEVNPSDSPTETNPEGPTLILKNVVIENSVATGNGGAISASAEVRVEVSTFTNNTAIGSGGAIYALGTVTVTSSIFESNTALRPIGSNPANENGPEGGAISGAENVTIVSSTFTSNQAEIGGAISADDVEISGSTFSRNTATLVVEGEPNLIGVGGAISLIGAGETSTISSSNFVENTAGMGGAIQVSPLMPAGVLPTNLIVTESTFTQNEAQAPGNYARGGAIVAPFTVSIQVTHSDFISNVSAADGGAIAIEGGFIPSPDQDFRSGLTIENTVFDGNRAELDGGAISVDPIMPTGVNIRYDVSITSKPLDEDVPLEDQNVGTTFTQNQASEYGGAISASSVSGDFKVSKVTFQENEASNGGAIHIEEMPIFPWVLDMWREEWAFWNLEPGLAVELWNDSKIEIDSSLFLRNFAHSHGGAVASYDDVVIKGTRFEANSANESGGAIDAGRVEIEGSTFIRNAACTSGLPGDPEMIDCPDLDHGSGGAISINSWFNEELADIWLDYLDFDAEPMDPMDRELATLLVGSLQLPSTITSSFFSENVAGGEGGAIWGYAWLFFNTFVNNRAEEGSSITLANSIYNYDLGENETSPQNRFSQSVGNLFLSEYANESHCAVPFQFSVLNQMTDISCALLEEDFKPILQQEFEIGVDISSLVIDPIQFGDEVVSNSLITSEFMNDFEERYRDNFDDFLSEAIMFESQGVESSFGLVLSVASLIFNLVEFLSPLDPDLEIPIIVDDSNLNLMIDSIFGPVGSPAGLKVDLMGFERPSTGCWTFGAIQSQEGINCEFANDVAEVEVPGPKSMVTAAVVTSSSTSTWKPRVPTQRELERKARLAALKAKIIEIRKNRVTKKAVLLEQARNRFKGSIPVVRGR